MSIAITGSTGHLGRLVIERLATRVPPTEIVAIARSAEKAAELGVPSRTADYDAPDTLISAMKGIDTLLLISASEVGKRVEQHHHLVSAAQAAGVKWVVYTSLLHADRSSLDLAAEHLATETELKASGIPFTILRNGWYTENYTGSIPGALAGGALLGSAGDGRISGAARADYADAAVAVLTRGAGEQGKTYELAGDEAWTLSDLAAEISRQSGKSIPYRNLPPEEYAEALQSFGLPEPIARMIAEWDAAIANGAIFDDSRQLSKLIGHPTTPLAVSVREALKG